MRGHVSEEFLMRGAAVVGAYAVMLGLSACEPSLDRSLEHKECSAQGACLPGYVCSEDGICVLPDAGSRNDPNSVSPDASEHDARVPVSLSDSCEGGSLCGGECVDTTRNVAHCGGCGRPCPSSEYGRASCTAGTCKLECNAGYTACADGCYALSSDPQHCGACSESCGEVEGGVGVCEAGQCGVRCLAGFSACGGACVRADVDPAHCGTCGNVCQPDQRCAGGACVRDCPAGTLECSRGCVNVQSDPNHCGACEKGCSAPVGAVASCQAGSCGWQCGGTLSKCGEACLDLQSDSANCGGCGKRCADAPPNATRACERGACVLHCAEGFTNCDGQCVSASVVEMARTAGLGMLGVCMALTALQNRMKCAGMGQNTTYCSGECVNIYTDPSHCGGCGQACGARQFCYRGACF
jgi:hypothetical protein